MFGERYDEIAMVPAPSSVISTHVLSIASIGSSPVREKTIPMFVCLPSSAQSAAREIGMRNPSQKGITPPQILAAISPRL